MRTYTVITVHPASDCRDDGKPDGYLWQYDYGQRVCFGGVDLPPAYEVHFSNTRGGESLTVIGDITGADIPDELLLTGQDIHVWLYLHQGETDGETVKYARIAVRQRAKPTHETPTPVQQDEITQAIAALGSAVDHVDDIAEAMPGEIQAALQEAKDSGEFDGPPGPQGEKGDTGAAGADGISPAASVSKSGGVATITITDADGTTTAEIYDGAAGKDGKDGKDGADGFSPSASVSKSGSTATITITDRTGTTTASVQDGADGADGQDGYTPVRGTDYWTAADQAQILEDVEDALIDDAAAAGDVTKVWSADKSSSEVSEVKSALDSKAPAIFRDVSGDIVSFSDGADNMPLSSCVVSIDPVQAAGTPSPENPLPITGWTGANIFRTGRNLVNKSTLTQGAIKSADGTITTSSTRVVTDYIPVKPNTTYIASFEDGKQVKTARCYDMNKNAIGENYGVSNLITTPPNAAYLRFTIGFSSSGAVDITVSDVQSPQLEIGSTAHAYTPYRGQTYSVDWQTAAGTMYGGTLDTVTGVLTVDRAKITLDKDGNYGISTGTPTNRIAVTAYQTTGKTNGTFVSDKLKTGANGAGGYYNEEYVIWGSTSAARMWISVPTTIDTVDKFKTWLTDNPIDVVYELATPTTVQLSAIEVLTLLGQNHLWADTGAISVTYPADTQTYVDSAIQTATDPDGNVVQVTGSTPSITGESGKRYVCGTVDSISITPPSTGIIDVVFTSGTTAALLTATGVTWPVWFNPNALDASTIYEINILNGLGGVMAWPI